MQDTTLSKSETPHHVAAPCWLRAAHALADEKQDITLRRAVELANEDLVGVEQALVVAEDHAGCWYKAARTA